MAHGPSLDWFLYGPQAGNVCVFTLLNSCKHIIHDKNDEKFKCCRNKVLSEHSHVPIVSGCFSRTKAALRSQNRDCMTQTAPNIYYLALDKVFSTLI